MIKNVILYDYFCVSKICSWFVSCLVSYFLPAT